MIVGKRKPLAEIVANVQTTKLLVVGCNTCVAVCLAGGEKEVAMLGSVLRLALRDEQPHDPDHRAQRGAPVRGRVQRAAGGADRRS